MTTHYHDYETAAKKIIDHVGKSVVVGVPLGIGKPIGLLNALYQLAYNDPSIALTIVTGLTLARPILTNELEKRFIEPILDRILKDYEDPLYEKARIQGNLPKNINVIEFFLTPGNYLNNYYVQQHYISSTYSNAVRDALMFSINVHAQQVARKNKTYSLSCNSDLFHDMRHHLKEYEAQGRKIAIVAEVNGNLPYMYGDAIVPEEIFSDIIDTKQYRSLFAIPRDELSFQDHLIGLHTSTLIKDDGCLQIGIGKLSNAVANALILRHKNHKAYTELLNELKVNEKFGETIASIGSTEPFNKGLYASTEMLSDEYMQLFDAEILKKQVYDHVGLQKLLNSGEISEKITSDTIDVLLKYKMIHQNLSPEDVQFLIEFGIFKSDIHYQNGNLIISSGEKILANLSSSESRKLIIQKCLGNHLSSGKIIHAGFFIGSVNFYSKLINLSDDILQKINMTSIYRTNNLLWHPELLRLQRQQARFVNSALMLTLGGAIISDGLKDYRELSGVGGQFDFVNMAQQLQGARSIINCPSTRKTKKGIESNVIWDYTNLTIPRYLRDIVITEYGIADCRGKVDSEVIKSILNITDSRFQKNLLLKAKKSGKISNDYEIPKLFQNNYPEFFANVIHKAQANGYCMPYPFGSDLTDDEKIIARALLLLKNSSKLKLLILTFLSLFFFQKDLKFTTYLQRMQLTGPKNIKTYLYKKLLKYMIYKISN